MTQGEVSDLVGRIVTRWPAADREAWAVVLEPVDFDTAERVLTILRQRLQRLPTTTEFAAEYAAQGPERNRMTPEEIARGLERVAWLKSVYAESRAVVSSTPKPEKDAQ